MQRGAQVTQADAVDQGLVVLRAKGADLIMIDVAQPIRRLVEALASERIRTPVVACGTGTDAKAAVAAIQAGAKEYIPLPPDPELIAAVIEAVTADIRSFVWHDPSMERVVKIAEQIARSDASILVTGESGTGKEVMARFIHGKSARKDKPFVSVNCAAIPDNLSRANSSGTRRAPSRARSPAASASSRRRTAARSCSTKSPRWTCACRPSSCAPSRSASSTASAARSPCASTSAFSPPRTGTSRTK